MADGDELYTKEQVDRMVADMLEALQGKMAKTGFGIAAETLQEFANCILDAELVTNSEAARIGAEAMRSKVIDIALTTARNFRNEAAKAPAD